MFRTTMTITHPTLTFSTPEEFIAEMEQYYDTTRYANAITLFSDGRLTIGAKTLPAPGTLVEVFDWDEEASYNFFYADGDTLIAAVEAEGFVRTVETETI